MEKFSANADDSVWFSDNGSFWSSKLYPSDHFKPEFLRKQAWQNAKNQPGGGASHRASFWDLGLAKCWDKQSPHYDNRPSRACESDQY
jgi:hypothetical protein